MTSVNGAVPSNEPASGSQTLGTEGLVLKYDASGELVPISAVGDDADAVLDQAVLDVEQNTRQTRDGEEIGVFLTGSGDVVNVAATGGTTFNKGDPVYLSSTDGKVNATDSGSDTRVGTYRGEDGKTTNTGGESIVVQLE